MSTKRGPPGTQAPDLLPRRTNGTGIGSVAGANPAPHAPPAVHWNPAGGGPAAIKHGPLQARTALQAAGRPPAVHWNPSGYGPTAARGSSAQAKTSFRAGSVQPPEIRWNTRNAPANQAGQRKAAALANAPAGTADRQATPAMRASTQARPGNPNLRSTAIQRMLSTDFNKPLNLNATIIQVPYDRSGSLGTSEKKVVGIYGDGTNKGVFKHFVPNNWLYKIFEAALAGAQVEVIPSISNRLIGDTLPPVSYVKTNSTFLPLLPISDRVDFDMGTELGFKTSVNFALGKFVDNPRNIFRGDSDGDGAGTKIDIPQNPSMALKQRLTGFVGDLIGIADHYLANVESIIVEGHDWAALKKKLLAAVFTLNSR